MTIQITNRSPKLVLMVLLALGVCTSLVGAAKNATETPGDKTAGLSGSEVISGYRQWTQVNPTPSVFASRIAIQCAAPAPDQVKMEAANPHRDKYIVVYVNELGKHAMMHEKVPHFPQGSVIVKEKLSAKNRQCCRVRERCLQFRLFPQENRPVIRRRVLSPALTETPASRRMLQGA